MTQELLFQGVARLFDAGLEFSVEGKDAVADGANGTIGSAVLPVNHAQLRPARRSRHAMTLTFRLRT